MGDNPDEKMEWAWEKNVNQDAATSNPLAFDDDTGGEKPPMKSNPSTREALQSEKNFKWSDYPQIVAKGYMQKETKADIRLIAAATWRNRFFVLYTPDPPYDKKNSLLMYFEDEISCQKYFKSNSLVGIIRCETEGSKKTKGSSRKKKGDTEDLVLGKINIAALSYFQESYRLDLDHRALELKTERRTWVLQVEKVMDYNNWFHEIWKALVKCNNQVVKMTRPNVWLYRMPGKTAYRLSFMLYVLAGVWWLYNLLIAGSPLLQPCVEDSIFQDNSMTCTDIEVYGLKVGYEYDTDKCHEMVLEDFWWYGAPNPFLNQGSEGQWKCYLNVDKYYPSRPPMYWLFVVAETLNLIFATMFYLGLWRPQRRGTRFLDNLNPPFPPRFWPDVDVLICHYSEPADDTMNTMEACLALEYPTEKLHIWVCDDGYCKTIFKPGQKWPDVKINQKLIQDTGDVREQLAELIREKIFCNDDGDPKAWRQQHTTELYPEVNGDQVVKRNDCAVGFLREDYTQYTSQIPNVHYVARMKTQDHHAKAGNINNCLYNAGASGRYIVILDNDMRPHPKFLKATLPLFYCKPGMLGGTIYDELFTATRLSETQADEVEERPDDVVILPTVQPAYGHEVNEKSTNKDLLSLDEQVKLRETCKKQAAELRLLKKKVAETAINARYQSFKRKPKKREKKFFEAGPPDDISGARYSLGGGDEDDTEYNAADDDAM